MIIHFMHLLTRTNVMHDFICMGPVDLPEARRKRQNIKWKSLAHSGTGTHNLERIFVLYMYCFVLHIGVYLYLTNSKETHNSCVCFHHGKHEQTLYKLRYNVWCFFFMLKANTGLCATLCYLSNIDSLNFALVIPLQKLAIFVPFVL